MCAIRWKLGARAQSRAGDVVAGRLEGLLELSCGRRGGVDQVMGEITDGSGSMDICIADNRGSASTRGNGREKWRVQWEGERGREVEGMSRAAAASGGEAADWASGGRCRGG